MKHACWCAYGRSNLCFCLCVNLSICLRSVSLAAYLNKSVCLLSVCLSVSLCLTVCFSLSLSLSLSLALYPCVCVCVCVCVCACVRACVRRASYLFVRKTSRLYHIHTNYGIHTTERFDNTIITVPAYFYLSSDQKRTCACDT